VHQGKERHGHLRCGAPTRCTRPKEFGNESVNDDYSADENWWLNMEMGGGFGWGMRLSGFGASKNDGYPRAGRVGLSRCVAPGGVGSITLLNNSTIA
jgi:hypothetical protein